MATIRTRKRGKTYSYNFDAGLNKNGKRKIVEKGGFASKQEAYDAGVKALAAYKNGNIAIVSEKVSTADFLDSWLTMKAQEVRPTTAKRYSAAIAKIKPTIGNLPLQNLRPRDINSLALDFAKEGLAYGTIGKMLDILGDALNYAVYPCELIQSNPAKYIKTPKNAPKNVIKRTVIDIEKMSELLSACPFGSPCHIPIVLAYHTGMRLGEVLGLCWSSVDFVKGSITVERQLVYTPATGYFFGEPKTASSKRKILIDRELAQLLKKWKAMQAKNEVAKGKTYVYCYEGENGGLWQIPKGSEVPEGLTRRALVCTHDNGKKATRHIIEKALRQFGLNFHSLRHTHATMLIENRAIAKDVAARLGHSNTNITQNLYTHDTEEMQKNTLGIFEGILQNVSKL